MMSIPFPVIHHLEGFIRKKRSDEEIWGIVEKILQEKWEEEQQKEILDIIFNGCHQPGFALQKKMFDAFTQCWKARPEVVAHVMQRMRITPENLDLVINYGVTVNHVANPDELWNRFSWTLADNPEVAPLCARYSSDIFSAPKSDAAVWFCYAILSKIDRWKDPNYIQDIRNLSNYFALPQTTLKKIQKECHRKLAETMNIWATVLNDGASPMFKALSDIEMINLRDFIKVIKKKITHDYDTTEQLNLIIVLAEQFELNQSAPAVTLKRKRPRL